jgi:hypothetical protein
VRPRRDVCPVRAHRLHVGGRLRSTGPHRTRESLAGISRKSLQRGLERTDGPLHATRTNLSGAESADHAQRMSAAVWIRVGRIVPIRSSCRAASRDVHRAFSHTVQVRRVRWDSVSGVTVTPLTGREAASPPVRPLYTQKDCDRRVGQMDGSQPAAGDGGSTVDVTLVVPSDQSRVTLADHSWRVIHTPSRWSV